MNIIPEVTVNIFNNRDNNIKHPELDHEFGFYKAISTGDAKMVEKYKALWIQKSGFSQDKEKNGILSQNPIQNDKYHFAILAAIISRLCVGEGLDKETAYGMSDLFIQKVDLCTSTEQISELRDTMINEYTKIMQLTKKQIIYSKQIAKAIDYIRENLNSRITLTDVAKYLSINPSYLSKLFSKETGQPISEYIKIEKLKAAANMLQYSDISITYISEYYHFSSQSHFTSAFTKHYGITPKRYRNQYINKVFE